MDDKGIVNNNKNHRLHIVSLFDGTKLLGIL